MVQNITSVLIASMALLSFIGSILIWVNILKYRIDSMQKTTEELRKDLRDSTQELRTVIVTVKAFSETQAVINDFTKMSLSQILHRLDMIESRLNNANLSNNKD